MSATILPTSKRLPQTDVFGLINSLMDLPAQHVCMKPHVAVVCMNPNADCSVCYFRESKWCLPREREAKAVMDAMRASIDTEHSTSIEEAYAATMEACA